MVQVTKQQVTTVKLELTSEEARWLKSLMQNPFGNISPDQEIADMKKMRLSFWNALGGARKVEEYKTEYECDWIGPNGTRD